MSDVVQLPIGAYLIGDDSIPNAQPRHRRELCETAWIDARPVSWAHFEVFVEGGGYTRELLQQCNFDSVDGRIRGILAQHVELKKQGLVPRKGATSNPVTGLTWFEAAAVAKFYRARLPYELEWEIANSGSVKGEDVSQEDSTNSITRSRLGCSVFIGRLQEWTLDAFSKTYWRADLKKRGNDWRPELGAAGVSVRGAGPDDIFRDVSYRFMSAPYEINAFRGFRRVWDDAPSIEDIQPSWRKN